MDIHITITEQEARQTLSALQRELNYFHMTGVVNDYRQTYEQLTAVRDRLLSALRSLPKDDKDGEVYE